MKESSFFVRQDQADFIQRVYAEAPGVIQSFFHEEGEMLRAALPSKGKVLEVGCGFGRALGCVSQDIEYIGMDIGLSYVLEAHSRNQRGNWVCADATKLPLGGSEFAAVFCIQNTLGNMEGIEESVIQEARRMLSADGKFIMSVYSEDSFDIRRLWYDRLIDIRIFGHIWLDPTNPKIVRSDTGWSSRCFDAAELERLLQTFSEVEIQKLDSFLYFCTAKV